MLVGVGCSSSGDEGPAFDPAGPADAGPAPGASDDATPPPAPPPEDRACTAASGAPVGSWKNYGSGECVIGARTFYRRHFNLELPQLAGTRIGSCLGYGACHFWLDDKFDPDVWERIPNDGKEAPSTYDIVIYPSRTSAGYGHVGAVDRVEDDAILVMDSNWYPNGARSPAPHETRGYEPYGWYHLKSLPKTRWCEGVTLPPEVASQACPAGAGSYCGETELHGEAGAVYACKDGNVRLVERCHSACAAENGTSHCE